MHRLVHLTAGFALATLLVCPVHAAVNDAAANGFSVTQTAHIAALPHKVYVELVQPGHWWSSGHTFSGSAGNLTLDARAGGCWCENLANGGSVRHLTVYFADPGQRLVLRGGLGPLQGLGVEGAMTIELKPAGNGTDFSLTYNVGGYLEDGLASWAAPVDGVLGQQVGRLKALLETGSPDAKK